MNEERVAMAAGLRKWLEWDTVIGKTIKQFWVWVVTMKRGKGTAGEWFSDQVSDEGAQKQWWLLWVF